MTTKYRIIFGFACMIAILLAVSVLGHRYLEASRAGLDGYRRSARVNVELSNSMALFNEARSMMNRYMGAPDKKIMENALQAMDEFVRHIDAAAKDMALKETMESAQKIRNLGSAYKENLSRLATAVTRMHDAYNNRVRPAGQELTDGTRTLRETAHSVGNVNVLARLEQMWQEYAYMLAGVGIYLSTHSGEDMKVVRQRAAAALAHAEKLSEVIAVEKGREIQRGMLVSFKKVFDALSEMERGAEATTAGVAVLRDLRAETVKELADLNRRFDTQMRGFGTKIAAELDNGQVILFGGSVGGIVVGLFLALFIIYSLIRVLREAGNFAGAVAKGDFSHVVKVKEGGEIGAMIESMRQIPAVLNLLVGRANTLSNDILGGYLRNRLAASDFSGSFADLAGAVNTVGDAFTRIVDNLGVPTMCCDSKCNILFLSGSAQQVVGGNLVGRSCADELKSPECNTGQCLGKKVMAQKGMVHGETTIHPQGRSIDVAVTAVPLLDMKNEAVGFMEVLTDITDITTKQATMVRVAQEAEQIAVRIAAASEELSAQVEEITHGTDMQRDRVGSTAGAMTEMNATVLEVARNAGDASEQIEGTRVKAQEGSELVNQVMTAINAVNKIGQNLQDNMQELGKQAESIGSVMNVISDIADQTNLLALNAAIEAARAGEAGRGFAVVADEVRKLAEKTMHATQEVGSSIRAVQHSARINIDEVGKAVSSVAEANTLADSSGAALNEIVSMAASNSAIVASIATAAEEQSATSEEINRDIDEINRIVAGTAESMVQSSSAVQTLAEMAQELHRVMGGLK